MTKSDIQEIRIEDYDYPLPDERIAKHPLEERDKCLLLVRDGEGRRETRLFADLPDMLPDDAMLVYISLIHISRCRRSYDCRSRWSPYH